jgi:hypothetical protein
MNITINAIELASELAERDLNEYFSGSMLIYQENEEETSYTEEAQEIFDGLYDDYLSWIKKFEINQKVDKNASLINGLYNYFGG